MTHNLFAHQFKTITIGAVNGKYTRRESSVKLSAYSLLSALGINFLLNLQKTTAMHHTKNSGQSDPLAAKAGDTKVEI